jgi:predicted ArsR family transcriptional regulator
MSAHLGAPGAGEPHAALASPSRTRLLALLRTSDTPQDAHDLARSTGLHVTTVRFHLDVLLQAGLASSRPQPRASAGRPRIVYAAVTRRLTADETGYQGLAMLLAAHLGNTTAERATRAEQAGAAWADQLVPTQPTPPATTNLDDAGRAVTALFAELGFEPALSHDGDIHEIRLQSCPYRAVARAHPEVVCAAHLGLLAATLSRLSTAPSTARLLPFVTPELCVASLTPQTREEGQSHS